MVRHVVQHAAELMPANAQLACPRLASWFCLLLGSPPPGFCHLDGLDLQMVMHTLIAGAGNCPVPADSPAILGGLMAAQAHIKNPTLLLEIPFEMPAFKVSYCHWSVSFFLAAAEPVLSGYSTQTTSLFTIP